MSLITAFGCCVFGLANGLFTASIGRMLIGFSAAFAFVCSLRPHIRRLARFDGLICMTGMLLVLLLLLLT